MFTYWACAPETKFKMVSTTDRIGNGQSEARWKLWYCGPVRDEMEWIYVSTKAIRPESIE